jgi:hypothetical protein
MNGRSSFEDAEPGAHAPLRVLDLDLARPDDPFAHPAALLDRTSA